METLISSSETNPYQAPASLDLPKMHPKGYWALWWSLIFSVNLVVPALFASGLLEDGGHLGVVVGVLILLAISIPVQMRFPRMIKWTRLAGLIVAMSQLLPMLHIIAGSIGIGVATSLGFLRELTVDEQDYMFSPPMSAPAALVTTLVTGAILLFAVAVLALLLKTIMDRGDSPPKGRWREGE